ncbi:tetratricopeptide repeat protein [Litoribrevibacter euphylliae]|uniref:Lipopolysaccharide assembly protein B n=1 Tax=Litoribrevibacter euphylliae TaxID=1834034 RepID=A0ABV7HEV0_9GAMM
MSDLLIFLAIFLSLTVGWLIGRYQGIFQVRHHSDSNLPSKYFKGLNYLINEQPDQAIHHFITLLEDDSESVELQLVLAKLFRKQGELDRAITVHQRLLARPDLSEEMRQKVHVELAQDYYSGGLHDRAEQLLLEANQHESGEAVQALLFTIWEEQKEWLQIIEMAKRFKSLPSSLAIRVVGACCEMSEAKPSESYSYLNLAEKYHAESVMLHFSFAQTHLREGHPRKALKRLKRLIMLDQSMTPVALPLLKRCFQEKGLWLTSYKEVLEDWYQVNPSISVVAELVSLIQKQDGKDAALIFLTEYLKIRPSIPGLVQLVDLHLKSEQEHDQATIKMFRNLCSQIIEERSKFQCQKCGYQSSRLYWQCPNCRKWESIRPVFGLEAE